MKKKKKKRRSPDGAPPPPPTRRDPENVLDAALADLEIDGADGRDQLLREKLADIKGRVGGKKKVGKKGAAQVLLDRSAEVAAASKENSPRQCKVRRTSGMIQASP